MDWNRMRQRWRQEDLPVPEVSIDELRTRESALRRHVRFRDLLETGAAVLVAVLFVLAAVGLGSRGQWLAAGFAVLLVAWAVVVPLRLRSARREAPDPAPGLPLVENLRRQRDAALAQARMLEQVWLWYLGPPMVGIFGMTLALRGLSMFALVYLAVVVLLYVGIAWFNRRAAKTKFRAHAERLQQQIDALATEEEP